MNSTSMKNVTIQYSIYSGDKTSLQWALPWMVGNFGFVSTLVGTTSQLKSMLQPCTRFLGVPDFIKPENCKNTLSKGHLHLLKYVWSKGIRNDHISPYHQNHTSVFLNYMSSQDEILWIYKYVCKQFTGMFILCILLSLFT
jgi:hypothetical protein